MEIDPTEINQGDNDYQEVDQTKIDVPTETSEGENHDEEVIPRLTSEICEGENHDEAVVIQLLTSEIPDSAKIAESLSSACIYMVSKQLRKLNKSAYTPRLIAIGPLHRKDKHLQTPMQHVKMSYMNNLLCRLTTGMENPAAEQKKLMVLQKCMAEMKASLDDAKKCYAEEVTLDEKMMLIDGCFILEFLYRLYVLRNHPEDFFAQMGADPIFENDPTLITIEHDLLLLENQIPFLVLEKLFPLTLAPARIPNLLHKSLSLTDYVFLPEVDQLMRPRNPPKEDSTNTCNPKTYCWPRDCISWVSGNKINNSKSEEKVPLKEVVSSGNAQRYYHILHKLHDDYLPHDKKETEQKPFTEELPSASDLVYAGVKFIRGSGGAGDDLFKVKFKEPEGLFWWYHRARFEIPFLLVDDSTESVLRNLIAFEQCCPRISQHFTSYAILMDMLVNYDKDVQVLEMAGVLRNCLGAAKDVTELFNNLSKEVSYGEFFFADTCNSAIKYRKHFWPKNIAYVRRKYFSSPWTFIAFCLGFIAFGITITKFIHGFFT